MNPTNYEARRWEEMRAMAVQRQRQQAHQQAVEKVLPKTMPASMPVAKKQGAVV